MDLFGGEDDEEEDEQILNGCMPMEEEQECYAECLLLDSDVATSGATVENAACAVATPVENACIVASPQDPKEYVETLEKLFPKASRAIGRSCTKTN
jgi:hypothetical protein